MSETITFTCSNCNYTTDDHTEVMPLDDYSGFECAWPGACERRLKRNVVLADIQRMANKPALHPVDKFSRTSVAVCGFLLGAVSATGISYLLFGV